MENKKVLSIIGVIIGIILIIFGYMVLSTEICSLFKMIGGCTNPFSIYGYLIISIGVVILAISSFFFFKK